MKQEPIQALLAEWHGPFGGGPPFDKIDIGHLGPAIDQASLTYLAEIDVIASDAEPPTFGNTLLPLERAGKALGRVTTIFGVMTANMNAPEIQALSRTVQPKLAGVWDQVNFNRRLFHRVKTIYTKRQDGQLNDEQRRLVKKTYDDFVRRGASLSEKEQENLGSINQTLAQHFTDFGNRVLAEENTWVTLTESDLSGLPKSLVSTYKAAASKRKVPGYVVVNTRSAVDPFLSFSTDRALRKKVWKAFTQRGDNENKSNTNGILKEIVRLRAKRAKLLGFESHAHWRMSDTMAQDPKHAMSLMMRVWPAAISQVKQEVKEMSKIAKSEGHAITLEPWDYRFYMEKVRNQKYALDQNEFKKYFELENMISAAHFMAERLYGYAFEEITGQMPVFHPDVRVFHVTNKKDGSHVGLLYRDDFAREHKRSGAWQATYQGQQKIDGQVDAIVSNNNNFIRGEKGAPVLISLDDAETLFHEFGHALHALSNDTTYPSLSSTPRDFVEFPSQVHENWVLTRDVLDRFARHYQTKEKMPQALIDKMRAAATFNQGFATVEYLAAAIVDMRLHMDSSGIVEPQVFERETLADIGMPKEIVLRHRLPHFMHLFTSDAYSAGYYSYLWSDVMAADAWTAFEETGDPWNPEIAAKFKDIILATGDAVDRAKAYKAFRGREPKVEALLKNRGLSQN